jgi:GLPGLI family protein
MKTLISWIKVPVVLLCLLLCFEVDFAKAQIVAGKITYERKTNLYKKFKDNDIKEWLKEEDKNKIDVFELHFNDSLSVFMPEESDLREKMSWATSKNTVYQNYQSGSRLMMKTIWGEVLWVQDSLYKRTWKVTESKRNICGYSCRKAIWQPNDSTRIYAWYCDEINVSTGPESFTGLPGAILGLATEDGGVIYFAKTVQLQAPTSEVLLPKKIKGKVYSANELKTKLEKDFGKQKWGKAMISEHFGIW